MSNSQTRFKTFSGLGQVPAMLRAGVSDEKNGRISTTQIIPEVKLLCSYSP